MTIIERLRSLCEERKTITDAAGKILKNAHKEKRNLTLEEQQEFDRKHNDAAEMQEEIELLKRQVEAERTVGDVPPDQRRAGREDRKGSDSPMFEDPSEERAIGPGETCVQYLEKRGIVTNKPSIGIGGVLRLLHRGAQTEDERRALNEGTTSAGGYLVPTYTAASIIDKLREDSLVLAGGAKLVPLTTKTSNFAKVATDPTMSWRAENSETTNSDPTFTVVTFTARTLGGLITVSRELIEDSAVSIDAVVTDLFSKVAAEKIDSAALFGADTDGPSGLTYDANINTVSMGNNGAAIGNWHPFLDAYQKLLEAKARPPFTAIMSPRTQIAVAKFLDSNGQPINAPQILSNVTMKASTVVPNTQTQGSANNASSVIMGDYGHLAVGMRTELVVSPARERYVEFGKVGFFAWLRCDIQLIQPTAFCEIVGIKRHDPEEDARPKVDPNRKPECRIRRISR